jgi:hypothetical protein
MAETLLAVPFVMTIQPFDIEQRKVVSTGRASVSPAPRPPTFSRAGAVFARGAKSVRALVDRFSSVDARSLGLLRVVLAALLCADLVDRFRAAGVLYSNDGVLSNHFSLFRPLAPFQFSIYVGASSAREATVYFAATLVVYLLFAVGYRTRLFHLLSFVCVASLHSRNLMAELPGDVPLHVWVGWALFLPLGARFSIDARMRRLSHQGSAPAAYRSIAVFGLLLQLSAMHLFAALRQAGPTWQDGTAIYYALRQNLWVTDLGAWIGEHVPAADLKTATLAYRAGEVLIGILVLVPTSAARRASLALLVVFHLGSRLLWNLGLYEWVMLGAAPLLVSSRDWDALGVKAVDEPAKAELGVVYDESARRSIARAVAATREVAALFFLVTCAVALARDMGDERVPSGAEAALYRVVAYPRLFQRWGLFAPDPPKRLGTLVAEAQTASGVTLDPITGETSPRRPDPLMAAYFTSISLPSRVTYVNELREYVRRTGDLRSPADKLVRFNVDWVESPIADPESVPEVIALSPVSRRITSGP